MFLSGTLSILQMIILPGLLALRLFPIPHRGITKLVVVISTSLIINHFLVILLTLTHLYTPLSLWLIICIECAALIYINRKRLLVSLEALAEKIILRIKSISWLSISDSIPTHTFQLMGYVLFLVFFAFAISDIAWMVRLFANNIGTVFNTWDAVVSWNRWAVGWSLGQFPTDASYYPQLLPANWSLSYVLLNHAELQFFPKFIMPLFSLLILLMLFDLGLQTRSFGFFIAIIFTRLIIKKFTGEYIADGYMDLPAAFFAFASIYLLLHARFHVDEGKFNKNWLIASGVLVSASALSKQAGIIMVLVFPLLTYLIVLRGTGNLSAREKRNLIFSVFGMALLITLPWYLYKVIGINLGLDSSNVAYVTRDIYGGAGIFARAISAFQQLGKYGPFLALLIPALLVVKQPYRWIGILLVIPYSIIWFFFFSYEVRNLALIFPLWGMIIGLTLQWVFEAVAKLLSQLRTHRIPASIFIVFLGLVVLVGAFVFPDQKLMEIEENQQWQILNPELSPKIRALVEETGTDITILSQFPINYLPGMRGTQISFWYDNLPDFLQALQNPDLDYLLVPASVDQEIEEQLQEMIENGKLQLIFTSEGPYPTQMYKLIR